jgi:hypothetical protein
VSAGWTQDGAEILPVCGDRRLHQRERVEDSHRFLVPPLRTQDLPEHFQRAWMMLVCTEHLQAFFLCGCKLATCHVMPRKSQQGFGIGAD